MRALDPKTTAPRVVLWRLGGSPCEMATGARCDLAVVRDNRCGTRAAGRDSRCGWAAAAGEIPWLLGASQGATPWLPRAKQEGFPCTITSKEDYTNKSYDKFNLFL